MKAAVYSRHGPPEVLRIEDVDRPVPGDNEVLVRIAASTVCAADYRVRKMPAVLMHLARLFFKIPSANKTKKLFTPGMEFSGVVDSVGKSVSRFKPCDRVFGATGFRFGANAEYACTVEDATAHMPANLTFEQAAAITFGGITALYFWQQTSIKPGDHVLVYGASGCVGSAAVQLAKHFGAHVTGVCSTANLEMVKSIGADEVIDYTKQDFSKSGRTYDIIFDAVMKSGYSRGMRALKRGGVFVTPGPGIFFGMFGSIWSKLTGRAKVVGGVVKPGPGNLEILRSLAARGRYIPVIDRCYPLADIVAAHRYADTGHKKGNVIIAVSP